MAAATSASLKPEGTAQAIVELLQEINQNLIENLKRQNERIAEIEAKLPNISASDVQKSTPAPILPEVVVEEGVSGATKDDHEDHADQEIEVSAATPASPLSQNAVPGSSSSVLYNWLEPPDVSGGFFANNPEVKTWFQEHIWIPYDGRVKLVFDIPSVDACRRRDTVKKICSGLREVSDELVRNRGRLLIIDNDCHGNNMLFGNLTPADWLNTKWAVELSTEYLSDDQYLSGDQYLSDDQDSSSRVHIQMNVPMIDLQERSPQHQWRRLIVLEGLADWISKDLPEFYLDIEGKFFPQNSDEGGVITEQFLSGWQKYHGGNLPIIKYSWFAIAPEYRVRKDLRAVVPQSALQFKFRQNFTGLVAGNLYGAGDDMGVVGRRWLGIDNYLIRCFPDSSSHNKKRTIDPYYTIVVARSRTSGNEQELLPLLPRFDAQICVLEHSTDALERIGNATAEILDYIEHILDIGDDILLDPRKHDQLLFDDDSFSRSRKYWWASNMLVPLRQKIEDSRKVHQQLVDDLIDPIKDSATDSMVSRDKSTWPKGLEEVDEWAAEAYDKLNKLLGRIIDQQTRVDTLRAGLFNASGVMESRASRRLGEIVKLLTYVSIFYLPLSFSTSLWSTTDTFHNLDTAMLFVVMIIIGGLTYTLVLNLEHVAQSTYDYYNLLKKQVIKPMKGDTEGWKDRARKYEDFEPVPTDTKPSEWWVLWYTIIWPFKTVAHKIDLKRTRVQNLRPPALYISSASVTGNDDWMASFPDISDTDSDEADIRISTSHNPTGENIPTGPTEKAAVLVESPSVPAEGGEVTSSHISEYNKHNSGWLSIRSIFTKSTQNGGGIDGERV